MEKKLLVKLNDYCKKNNWRFGQFVWNILSNRCDNTPLWESPEGNALFYISDEDLEKRIKKFLD